MSQMPEQVASPFSIHYSLLTTWILWRNLLHPHDPPLFRRTLRLPLETTPIPQTSLVYIILLLSLFACCGLIQLRSALTILVPIAVVALSSSYVIVWVVRVTDTI